MNIKEAVLAFCAIEVNNSAVELEVINSGLNPGDDYTTQDERKVARTACNVLSTMLVLDSLKEGDLTISYNREGMIKRLLLLASKYGFAEIIKGLKPKVIDRSEIW
jgi:hypothetical protein